MRKQRALSRFRAAASIARLCTGFQGSAGEEGDEDSKTEDSEQSVNVNGHVNVLARELTVEE